MNKAVRASAEDINGRMKRGWMGDTGMSHVAPSVNECRQLVCAGVCTGLFNSAHGQISEPVCMAFVLGGPFGGDYKASIELLSTLVKPPNPIHR